MNADDVNKTDDADEAASSEHTTKPSDPLAANDDELDDEDDEDEEDEDEPEKASLRKRGGGSKRSGSASARRKPATGSAGKALIYVLLVGAIAVAFAYLGQMEGGSTSSGPPRVEWKEKDTVKVAITLVTTDVNDLACASSDELEGLRCGFVAKNKRSPKGNKPRQDPQVLQPYTTVDRIQFMAAGLWQQPELKARLDKEDWSNPSPRFTVHCKLDIKGKVDTASVRWKPEEGWYPANGWWAGSVTECKIKELARGRPFKRKDKKDKAE